MNKKFKILLCSLLIMLTGSIQASLNQGHNANLQNGLTIVADDPKMTIYQGTYRGQKVVIEEFVINSKCGHVLGSGEIIRGTTKQLVYNVDLEHDEWFHRAQSSNLQEKSLFFKFHKTDVKLPDTENNQIVLDVLNYFNLHRRAHEFAFEPSK